MSKNIHDQRILILDFGSQVTQLIARRVREIGVYCELWAWDVTGVDQIDRHSLKKVFDAANAIDTLIVGTATDVWVPPRGLREELRAVGIVLDPMQTGPAIRTYNIMLGERRRVAAALIAVP